MSANFLDSFFMLKKNMKTLCYRVFKENPINKNPIGVQYPVQYFEQS